MNDTLKQKKKKVWLDENVGREKIISTKGMESFFLNSEVKSRESRMEIKEDIYKVLCIKL